MGECVDWTHMTNIIRRRGHVTLNEPCFGTQSGKIVDWPEKVSFWKNDSGDEVFCACCGLCRM